MSEATQALIARHVAEYNELAEQERHIEPSFVDHCGFSLFEAFQIALDEKKLPPEARLLCEAIDRFTVSKADIAADDPEMSRQRLAYVMYFDVILTSPDAVMTAIKRVRDELVHGDPKLALMK